MFFLAHGPHEVTISNGPGPPALLPALCPLAHGMNCDDNFAQEYFGIDPMACRLWRISSQVLTWAIGDKELLCDGYLTVVTVTVTE